MNATPLSLAVLTILIVFIMQALTDKEIKKTVIYWTLAGIAVGILKNLLIQMMPQWTDTPVDSLTYQLHAQALYMHWMGLPVDANTYKLAGYLNYWGGGNEPYWLPTDKISYAGVFGTHEWIYSGFLAVWKLAGENSFSSAIIANAVMAGAFPAATYVITRELGGAPKVCHIAALLVTLDPSIAVNSTWLLKDTLATLLSIIVIICACQLCNRASLKFTATLAISLGLLGAVKFVAFIAFGAVFFGLTVFFILKKSRASAAALSIASVISVMIWGTLYFAPLELRPDKLTTTVSTTLRAQTTTLNANQNDTGADASVIEWRSYWRHEPVRAALRSVVRTLFAPYPWVAITHGLTGNNQIELYLLGTIFWIIALPGTLIGLVVSTKKNTKACALLALLGIITAAYIIFFGEWSTRQRIFLIPLLFSFSALGWHWLWKLIVRPKF